MPIVVTSISTMRGEYMAINGTFRFHPVGQGLFYSGLISATGPKHNGVFSFVYDCGSTSPRNFLNGEIDDLKALLPRVRSGNTKRLDMLIVSHLHDDHVNGLEYLLDDIEVDTVVMPYMDSITRLLARAESLGEEAFLDSFYADSVGWFASKGVRRILLVGSPPEMNYQDEESDGGTWRQEDRGISVGSCILGSERVAETEILYLDDNALATISQFWWRFRFCNLKFSQEGLYNRIVEDFQREKEVALDDIFRNKHLTRELVERLKPVFLDGKIVNRTSVVTIHEPILTNGEKTVFHTLNPQRLFGIPCGTPHCNNMRYYKRFVPAIYQSILTGDIEIREKDILPLEEELHFGKAVFQYPHHGARKAIPRRFLPKVAISVFSAGIINRYGHPNPELFSEQHFPVLVNERNSFDYSISIIVDSWTLD